MTEIMKRIYNKELATYREYKKGHPDRPYFNNREKERAYFNLLANYGFMYMKDYMITMFETLERLTCYEYEELKSIWNEIILDRHDPELYYEEDRNTESAIQYFVCVALEEDF